MFSPSLLLLASLALPTLVHPAPANTQDEPAPPKKAEPAPTPASLAKAVRKASREVAQAELGVRLADLKSEEDLERADLEVDDKKAALDAAEAELTVQVTIDGPAVIKAATLTLDRAKSRLVTAQADLEGILRIYAQEEEALAKNEIIRRHEVSVEFSQQEAMAAAAKLERAVEHSVKAANQAKRWAVEKAKRQLRLAERARERAALAAELAVLKASDAHDSARQNLEEAERQLASSKALGDDK